MMDPFLNKLTIKFELLELEKKITMPVKTKKSAIIKNSEKQATEKLTPKDQSANDTILPISPNPASSVEEEDEVPILEKHLTEKPKAPKFVLGKDNSKLKPGDKCFALYAIDKLEYTAEIVKISPSGVSCSILYLDDDIKKTQKNNTLRKYSKKEEAKLRKIFEETYPIDADGEITRDSTYDIFEDIRKDAEEIGISESVKVMTRKTKSETSGKAVIVAEEPKVISNKTASNNASDPKNVNKNVSKNQTKPAKETSVSQKRKESDSMVTHSTPFQSRKIPMPEMTPVEVNNTPIDPKNETLEDRSMTPGYYVAMSQKTPKSSPLGYVEKEAFSSECRSPLLNPNLLVKLNRIETEKKSRNDKNAQKGDVTPESVGITLLDKCGEPNENGQKIKPIAKSNRNTSKKTGKSAIKESDMFSKSKDSAETDKLKTSKTKKSKISSKKTGENTKGKNNNRSSSHTSQGSVQESDSGNNTQSQDSIEKLKAQVTNLKAELKDSKKSDRRNAKRVKYRRCFLRVF